MIEHGNKCKVKIKGLPPGILLNNPGSMLGKKTSKKEIYVPEIEAENKCYWNKDKTSLVFPAVNFKSGLIRAASGMKSPMAKKLSLAPLIAGDIEINPDLILFNICKYEIDIRRAVIQRQGILRARPLIPEWELEFEISWEEQYLTKDFHEIVLSDLLERLGKTIGIGDFRPEKKGPFGRFEIIKIIKL